MLSPDGLEGAQALGSLNVADHADNDYWGRLQNGNGFNDLLLVDLGAGLVDFANDMGHASLVSHKSGQVDWLGLIILGESLHLAPMTLGALLRSKGHGAMARRRELAVRLWVKIWKRINQLVNGKFKCRLWL